MTTIRVGQCDGIFTEIHNQPLRDKRLSFKARGLLALMLSYSDSHEFTVEFLARQSLRDGKAAVTSAIQELEKLGYIKREQKRENGKFVSDQFVVYEIPLPTGD